MGLLSEDGNDIIEMLNRLNYVLEADDDNNSGGNTDNNDAAGEDQGNDANAGDDNADAANDDNGNDNNQDQNNNQDDNNENQDTDNNDTNTDDTDMSMGGSQDTGDTSDTSDNNTDQSGDNNAGEDADQGEDESLSSDIKSYEKELYSTLSPEERIMKNKILKRQYVTLYNTCQNAIDKFNNITSLEDVDSQIRRASNILYDLKNMISDYVLNVYNSKSYIENDVQFNRYLAILSTVKAVTDDMVNHYKEKDGKLKTEYEDDTKKIQVDDPDNKMNIKIKVSDT